MTKVGVYSIIRVFTLIFGVDAGAASLLGYDWLWWLGLATLGIGAIGVLGSRDLRAVIAYLVVISIGTMLTTFSMNSERAISAVMFYMLHSTLITGALFYSRMWWRSSAENRFPYCERAQDGAARYARDDVLYCGYSRYRNAAILRFYW